MKHLSDEIIQEYLDSSGKSHQSDVKNHLVICPVCVEKVERYKELYSHLAADSDFNLGRDFKKNVMAAIQNATQESNSYSLYYILAAVFGLVSCLTILDLFEVISMAEFYNSTTVLVSGWMSPVTETLSALAVKLNGNLELLAFAAVAVVLFQLLDYGLVQAKLK